MENEREEMTFTTLGASGGAEHHTYVIQVNFLMIKRFKIYLTKC
jgi:hypothetical protein